jgi:hypothetical protein
MYHQVDSLQKICLAFLVKNEMFDVIPSRMKPQIKTVLNKQRKELFCNITVHRYTIRNIIYAERNRTGRRALQEYMLGRPDLTYDSEFSDGDSDDEMYDWKLMIYVPRGCMTEKQRQNYKYEVVHLHELTQKQLNRHLLICTDYGCKLRKIRQELDLLMGKFERISAIQMDMFKKIN